MAIKSQSFVTRNQRLAGAERNWCGFMLIVIVTIKLFAGREMEWDGGWWDWMVVNQPPTGTVHRNDSTTLRSIPQMKRSIVEMLGWDGKYKLDTIPRNQPESFAFHARSIFKSVDSHAFVLMVVHILRLCQLCQDIYIVHSTKSASGWRHSSICLRSPVSHKYPYSYTSNQQQQLTTAANNTTTTCLITWEHHLLIFCWHSLHLHLHHHK